MPHDGFARVAAMEASLYMRNQLLRDADWASMAHSLEVRTPLVDVTLLERVAALGMPASDAPAKQELALAPSTPLPAAITTRAKTGFGVPVGSWMPGATGGGRAAAHGYSRQWARYVAAHQPTSTAPGRLAA